MTQDKKLKNNEDDKLISLDYYKKSSNFLKTLNVWFWLTQIGMIYYIYIMMEADLMNTATDFFVWLFIFIFNFILIGGVRDLRFMINDTNERLNELEGKSNDDD